MVGAIITLYADQLLKLEPLAPLTHSRRVAAHSHRSLCGRALHYDLVQQLLQLVKVAEERYLELLAYKLQLREHEVVEHVAEKLVLVLQQDYHALPSELQQKLLRQVLHLQQHEADRPALVLLTQLHVHVVRHDLPLLQNQDLQAVAHQDELVVIEDLRVYADASEFHLIELNLARKLERTLLVVHEKHAVHLLPLIPAEHARLAQVAQLGLVELGELEAIELRRDLIRPVVGARVGVHHARNQAAGFGPILLFRLFVVKLVEVASALEQAPLLPHPLPDQHGFLRVHGGVAHSRVILLKHGKGGVHREVRFGWELSVDGQRDVVLLYSVKRGRLLRLSAFEGRALAWLEEEGLEVFKNVFMFLKLELKNDGG